MAGHAGPAELMMEATRPKSVAMLVVTLKDGTHMACRGFACGQEMDDPWNAAVRVLAVTGLDADGNMQLEDREIRADAIRRLTYHLWDGVPPLPDGSPDILTIEVAAFARAIDPYSLN